LLDWFIGLIYIVKSNFNIGNFMAKTDGYFDSPSSMEPMLPEESERELDDCVAELLKKSSNLAGRLYPEISESVGTLVRSMNCYYSNLIEGHNTHPRDIDRALHNDYSTHAEKRILQLEATAHIAVQEMIDRGHDEISENPVSVDTLRWIHKEFCTRLPEELWWVENPDDGTRIRMEPGALRTEEVQVGVHIPPIASSLPRFLERFERAYNPAMLSQIRQVIAVAASHHRLLWIHPFYDGNGRVTRLFSHVYLRHIGVGSSLWSVSRGLARQSNVYKSLLMQADGFRQGDLDGRGNLTAKGLKAFCLFFLTTCIDQVDYMASILEPSELLRRMEIYTEEEHRAGRLPKGTFHLLREALLAGSFERGKAASITGYKDRQARTVLSLLLEKELLVSDSPRGAVRLGFPIDVVERWFPKLYPVV
jgi:Fic family protein